MIRKDGKTVMENKTLPLIPVRMLNEYVYCPRLFYLEWVQGEFEHNYDTLEGKLVHRNVDRETGNGAEPENIAEEEIHATSVMMSSERLGIICKMDIVEGEQGEVHPIDYKKGEVPNNEMKSYEPERIQLCAQALILRENGYTCNKGIIYYAGSRTRITVPISDELITETLKFIEEAKDTALSNSIPSPLVDSPKCYRCSLVGICLPDEITSLSLKNLNEVEPEEVRRLFPASDDALPLYVQEQGAIVTKNGEEIEIRNRGSTIATAKFFETSSVSLFGNVQVTTQAIRELCQRGTPVCHLSYGGWLYGITSGMMHKNVLLRQKQYRTADGKEKSLLIARRFVCAKIRNCRTMLRRNCKNPQQAALEELARLSDLCLNASSLDELLGIEGAAGRVYFAHFADMIKTDENFGFDFHSRNRRPPKDPVNALLSFAYSLLASTTTIVVLNVGFDPYLGFFHQPRYGRPSLALDLMEEFRPLIADSSVISALNNKEITPDDFEKNGGSVALKSDSRKKMIRCYERRLETQISHPLFGYSISYRRVLEVQARLLARTLSGEIKEYPMFLTR